MKRKHYASQIVPPVFYSELKHTKSNAWFGTELEMRAAL